jgi:hypothetical protein
MTEFIQSQQRFLQPGRQLGELPFFAHQPESIRAQWLHAMGLDDENGRGRNGRAQEVAERV